MKNEEMSKIRDAQEGKVTRAKQICETAVTVKSKACFSHNYHIMLKKKKISQ
jgi:hypothetical protein